MPTLTLVAALVAGVWASATGGTVMGLALSPGADARLVIRAPGRPPLYFRGAWHVHADSLCVASDEAGRCWHAELRGTDTLIVADRVWVRAVRVPSGSAS